MAYRVLIVDDQRMSRQLFASVVVSDSRYTVAAAIETALVADAWCAKGGIDLIIMDVVMKDGSNGLDAAERIKRSYPNVRIIIVTSMPEVAQEAALLVDPFNEDAIADAMVKVLDDEVRQTLIAKGRLRAQDFSWDHAAEVIWNSIIKSM